MYFDGSFAEEFKKIRSPEEAAGAQGWSDTSDPNGPLPFQLDTLKDQLGRSLQRYFDGERTTPTPPGNAGRGMWLPRGKGGL